MSSDSNPYCIIRGDLKNIQIDLEVDIFMRRTPFCALAAGGLTIAIGAVCASDLQTMVRKPNLTKGMQLYEQGDAVRSIPSCASCHAFGGNSTMPANPNLSGMPHEYLAKQLRDFKIKDSSDKPDRNGPACMPTIMTTLVANLTEADIQNIALYLAMQPAQSPITASDKNLQERGRLIWRGGLAEHNVPACASCHDARGRGIPSLYPRLSGQFPCYIEAQMKAFSSGARNNSAPMRNIANRMTDADIQAVSDYAASLR